MTYREYTAVLLDGVCTCEKPRRSGAVGQLASLLPGFRQVLGDEVPVDQMVEEGLHEVGPAVLVVEIIGVLPNVAGQQRRLALRPAG